MESKSVNLKEKKFIPYIIAAAIAIPVVVTILAVAPKMEILGDFNYFLLPLFNAIINGSTFFVLLAAFWAIKNKNIVVHRKLMTVAIVLSVIFLLSYVTFHAATEPTKFEGVGGIRTIYYFLLLSHILLAIVIVPLVLISYVRALSEKFDQHRKIAKITLPIWLYVTSTGVIVYLMIAPYYPS
jgi:putative membrane protein